MKHISAERYKAKFEEKYPGEYLWLSEFHGWDKPLKCKHIPCGTIHEMKARDYLVRGCSVCKKLEEKAKKAEQFYIRFDTELKGEYIRMSEYTGSHEPLTALHIPCGEVRTAEARNFFTKRCPICARAEEARKRADKRAEGYIKQIEAEYNVTAVSQYHGAREPMRWRCNLCGAVMAKAVENILWRDGNNAGGLICDCHIEGPTASISSGEFEIIKYLRGHGISYRREVCFDTCRIERPLPFDFIIYDKDGKPTHAIEFNGEQHYKAVELFGGEEGLQRLKESEKRKAEWCKEHGLPLLVIRYDADVVKEIEKFLF